MMNDVHVTLFETVTVTGDDVVVCPAPSLAFETMVCGPLEACVVFHEYASDEEFVFEALADPSMSISSEVTPTSSEAVALMLTVPDTVAPLEGAVMDVVGGLSPIEKVFEAEL